MVVFGGRGALWVIYTRVFPCGAKYFIHNSTYMYTCAATYSPCYKLSAIQRHQAAHLVKDKSFTTRYVVSKGGGKDGRETMCSTHKVSFCVAGITFFSVR